LGRLVQEARKRGLISSSDDKTLRTFVETRNMLAHGRPVARNTRSLEHLIREIEAITARLESGYQTRVVL
jgi:hypothetical protein